MADILHRIGWPSVDTLSVYRKIDLPRLINYGSSVFFRSLHTSQVLTGVFGSGAGEQRGCWVLSCPDWRRVLSTCMNLKNMASPHTPACINRPNSRSGGQQHKPIWLNVQDSGAIISSGWFRRTGSSYGHGNNLPRGSCGYNGVVTCCPTTRGSGRWSESEREKEKRRGPGKDE